MREGKVVLDSELQVEVGERICTFFEGAEVFFYLVSWSASKRRPKRGPSNCLISDGTRQLRIKPVNSGLRAELTEFSSRDRRGPVRPDHRITGRGT